MYWHKPPNYGSVNIIFFSYKGNFKFENNKELLLSTSVCHVVTSGNFLVQNPSSPWLAAHMVFYVSSTLHEFRLWTLPELCLSVDHRKQ